MIVNHSIEGSKDTSFHDFKLSVNGLVLSISDGSYYQADEILYHSDLSFFQNIPMPTQLTEYEIWLTKIGFVILSNSDNGNISTDNLSSIIDKLVWFSVPANCTDLSTIDVHFIDIVES